VTCTRVVSVAAVSVRPPLQFKATRCVLRESGTSEEIEEREAARVQIFAGQQMLAGSHGRCHTVGLGAVWGDRHERKMRAGQKASQPMAIPATD
jgi:hypothetical protein